MSRRPVAECIRRLCGAMLLLCVATAHSIDAPQPATPPAEAAAPAKIEIKPTDETAFYERLQYVSHKRILVGLGISDDVLKTLAAGSSDGAIAGLSQRSAAGDLNAT